MESADIDVDGGGYRRVVCVTSSPTTDIVVRKVVAGSENIFFADWKNRLVWKLPKDSPHQVWDEAYCISY